MTSVWSPLQKKKYTKHELSLNNAMYCIIFNVIGGKTDELETSEEQPYKII